MNGRSVATYTAESSCVWCKMSKLRFDLESQVITIKNGQAVDSSYIIKNLCSHCLTVCDEAPKLDFICAKCRSITLFTKEDSDIELNMFENLFSELKDGKFADFYNKLVAGGKQGGKRYCISCVYKIWRDYLMQPNNLCEELEKPKVNYPPKETLKNTS
jgi:hypothetical protein